MIAYVCTVDVASVDASIATVEASGGTVVLPKMAVPGVGWLVYCKDTEGNIFGDDAGRFGSEVTQAVSLRGCGKRPALRKTELSDESSEHLSLRRR